MRGTATDTPCGVSSGCPAFSVSGAGAGIGGTSDQFMFLYQKLTGDGAVTVRLLALSGTSTVEAGLMMRESLAASARHASILMSGAGVTLRSRLVAGGTTVSSPAARGTWLRLERAGAAIKASVSSDGSQWSTVATQTLALPSIAYVGIVVTSRAATTLATATVSNMSVLSTTPSLPSGWTSADVGSALKPGTALYANGSFISTSSGLGFSGGAADGFRFVYTRVRSDAKLSTRVAALQGAVGRQAGIVLRTTLDAGAMEVALVADDAGLVLVTRAGASQSKTRVATAISPVMLQLDRRGSMVTASYSIDGVTWKMLASCPISLGDEIYAGLAVAAGPSGILAAAAFDRLSLVSVPANKPPVVSLSTPLSGQLFVQGNPVVMTAAATDPDDLVARVDFRVNGVAVASDTVAPYSASWIAGAPGVYSIAAAASDFDGAVTTSVAALVTVTTGTDAISSAPAPSAPSGSGSLPPPTGPWRLTFDASPDHATITYYALEIYSTVTRALVLTRDIGKPARAIDGSCTVDVDALVSSLPSGLYDGMVRAVAPIGSSASFAYTFTR